MTKIAYKTKPKGVSFNIEMMRVLKEDKIADTYQQALNFLSDFYLKNKHIINGTKPIKEMFDESKLFKQQNKPIKENKIPDKTIIPKQEGLIDFGDDKWLDITKYTKFPEKDKPKEKYDIPSWNKKKKESDDLIRAQYNIWKNNKK